MAATTAVAVASTDAYPMWRLGRRLPDTGAECVPDSITNAPVNANADTLR